MQDQIKDDIDKAIHAHNIQKLRSYLNSFHHSLINKDIDIDYFSDYLIYLLNLEKFLNLGGAIYILNLCSKILGNITKQEEEEEIIKVLRLAYEKFDALNLEFLKKLTFTEAIRHQSIPIEDCIEAIDNKVSEMNCLSEEYFTFILEIIRITDFLNLDKSWELLALIEIKWDVITETQKEKLFMELENIYGKSKDWMFDFIISELLGEYYSNEPAFEVLRRLSKIDNEQSRALVPHGLEHLVKDSGNKEISTKAYQLLLKMKQDSSELVRTEVMESLRKLDV